MIDKVSRAMTMATVACWECGDRGYDYTCGLAKTDNETLFILITIYNGEKEILDYMLYVDDPSFDAIIDQMVLDIAEKTKDLV